MVSWAFKKPRAFSNSRMLPSKNQGFQKTRMLKTKKPRGWTPKKLPNKWLSARWFHESCLRRFTPRVASSRWEICDIAWKRPWTCRSHRWRSSSFLVWELVRGMSERDGWVDVFFWSVKEMDGVLGRGSWFWWFLWLLTFDVCLMIFAWLPGFWEWIWFLIYTLVADSICDREGLEPLWWCSVKADRLRVVWNHPAYGILV